MANIIKDGMAPGGQREAKPDGYRHIPMNLCPSSAKSIARAERRKARREAAKKAAK